MLKITNLCRDFNQCNLIIFLILSSLHHCFYCLYIPRKRLAFSARNIQNAESLVLWGIWWQGSPQVEGLPDSHSTTKPTACPSKSCCLESYRLQEAPTTHLSFWLSCEYFRIGFFLIQVEFEFQFYKSFFDNIVYFVGDMKIFLTTLNEFEIKLELSI